ncbi:MAG: DUF4118 domain-containing protein [Acidimicrobiia bacterium]
MAVVGPPAVALVLLPLRGEIRDVNVALVLVVVVLVAAVIGGRWGGAVAAVTAALSFDFFFTHPYGSFRISTRDDVETTVLLLVVGLVTGELVTRTRRSREVARTSRREMHRMRTVAEVGAGNDTPTHLIESVRRELEHLLPAERVWFERPPFAVELPQLRHGRVAVPPGDPAIGALDPTPPQLVELRVAGGGRVRGRFVFEFAEPTTGVALPVEARASAVALADQLGVALTAMPDDCQGKDQS